MSKLFAIFSILFVLVSSMAFASHNILHSYGGREGSSAGRYVPTGTVTTVAPLTPFEIEEVRVDDVELQNGVSLYLERGTTVPVEVYVRGNQRAYDARVRVYLGGYEYGDVEALSDIFEVEKNVVRPIRFNLQIPYDLEASEYYTLHVELFDDDNSVKETYRVRVQETRHFVNVFDVIFNPMNNVQAGQYLFATVRVENLGDNIEDTVKVTLRVPSLDLQTSQFVNNELITQEHFNQGSELAESRRVSATTGDLMLQIPQNTPAGDYEVVVTAEYDRGFGRTEKRYLMHVNSVTPSAVNDQSLTVNVDTNAQRVTEGQGAQFVFTITNLGQTARTFDFEVTGTEGWGTYRVDPQTLTVQPNDNEEVKVFVAPQEGVTGSKSFTVKVKSNGNVVAEKTLSVESVQGTGADTAKKVLAGIFIVLLVILVILAIAVIIKKATASKEEGPVEGQTYY